MGGGGMAWAVGPFLSETSTTFGSVAHQTRIPYFVLSSVSITTSSNTFIRCPQNTNDGASRCIDGG